MTKLPNIDLYQVLRICKNSDFKVLKKSYKSRASKFHPDICNSEDKKSYLEAMVEINLAYEILSNPIIRRIYDSHLKKLEKSNKLEASQTSNLEDYLNNLNADKKYKNTSSGNNNNNIKMSSNHHFSNKINRVYNRSSQKINIKNLLKVA